MYIKEILHDSVRWIELAQGSVTVSCDKGNRHWILLQGGGFPYKLSNYQFLGIINFIFNVVI
jgi:hypothetical protein